MLFAEYIRFILHPLITWRCAQMNFSSHLWATLTERKISMVFRYENCMVEEATTTAPVTDFLQGVHDSLFSKLFYS